MSAYGPARWRGHWHWKERAQAISITGDGMEYAAGTKSILSLGFSFGRAILVVGHALARRKIILLSLLFLASFLIFGIERLSVAARIVPRSKI